MKYVLSRYNKQAAKEVGIYLFLVAILYIILIMRASLVPPIFDEANSFYYYIQNGRFLPFLSEPDTNNHLLNSALSFILMKLFGDSLFVLRMGNLLAFSLYAYFVFKISNGLKSNLLKWILRIVLLFTLHLIEFFALGRGYGLSFALFTGALFFIPKGIQRNSSTDLFYGFMFIFLATMANLAFIYTFWLLLAWVVANFWLHKRFHFKFVRIVVVPALLMATLSTYYIFYLRSINELVAGNNAGLWSTTIQTLFGGLSDSKPFSAIAVNLSLGLILSILWFIILKVRSIKFDMRKYFSFDILMVFLLLGNVLAIVLTTKLFGINYPDERIGTHLFITSVVVLVFLTDTAIKNSKWSKASVIFCLPLLFYPLHFVAKINTSYSVWYKSNNIPLRFYDKVSNTGTNFPAVLSAYHIKSLCWSMADYNRAANQNPVYWNTYPADAADFMIVEKSKSDEFRQLYHEVDYDKISDCILLKRTMPPSATLLAQSQQKGSDLAIRQEFMGLMELDTLPKDIKTLRVNFDISIFSPAYPFSCMVVVSAEDSLHKALGYEYLRCNHMRGDWRKGTAAIHNSLLLYNLPAEATTIKVYIWNQALQPFTMTGAKIWLWKLE